jgi:hypothetical protein
MSAASRIETMSLPQAASCQRCTYCHAFGRRLTLGDDVTEPQGRRLLLALAIIPAHVLERIAHHARLRWQRFFLTEAENAVHARDTGNPSRQRCGFCRGPLI